MMSFPGYQIRGCIKYFQGEEEWCGVGVSLCFQDFHKYMPYLCLIVLKVACSFPFFVGIFGLGCLLLPKGISS